jgi:hypothetical protein
MQKIRTLVTLAACLVLMGCSTAQNGAVTQSGVADQVAEPHGGVPSTSQVCEATGVNNMLVDLVGEQTFGKPLAEEKKVTLFGAGNETSCHIGWSDGFGFAALIKFESDKDAKASHDANAGAIAQMGKIAKKFTGAASGAELAAGTKLDMDYYAKEGKEELLIHCVGVKGSLGVTVGFKRLSPALPQEEHERASTALCVKADELIANIQGPVNGSTAPGAIAVPTDPSSPQAPDEVSIGLWAGQVTGDRSRYDILVDLKKEGSAFVAMVDYPQLKCEAAWKEERSDAEAVYLRERLVSGRCENNVQVKLTKANEQVLHAEFIGTTVQADMTRIGD